jgi:RNA polymerase sigma-70 factor (ECF subfamily)
MDSFISIRLPGFAVTQEEQKAVKTETPPSLPANDPSDETLILEIRNGSREALAVLFRRYARRIRSVAYRVLRNPTEADDLLQDIFLSIQDECESFDSAKGTARFWLMQMAYRRAISRRRYLSARHFYNRVDIDDAADQISGHDADASLLLEESVDGKFGNGSLNKVFGELSENQRQTLCLFFIEGYTLEEIAEKLGQSRGNVKHHYFRGLERLRKELFGSKVPGEKAV